MERVVTGETVGNTDTCPPPEGASNTSLLGNASAPDSGKESVPQGGPELSVVVPTFNERANVIELVNSLRNCLAGIRWEVIFVDDDSHDKTAEAVREIALHDHRVRCIQRIGRRGLSTACIEGMLASSAPYLAVIDGDLQHDERLLPQMLETLKNEDIDVVVGSRYAAGGSLGEWDSSRANISHLATWLSRSVLRAHLSDPMSGFFMLRRGAFESSVHDLSGMGFKILVDLFASSPKPMRFVELPYEFRRRKAGESKLDAHVAWDYLMLLLDKLIGHIVPVRFIAFGFVGGIGVGVHLTVLAILLKHFRLDFTPSQAIAAFVAMTSNYALNNILTYRDMRLTGWRWFRGWASFTLACSVGAIANVGIASYLFGTKTQWLLAATAGILVGTVWNYAVTRVYTWSSSPKVTHN